jgi:hypothetical protein
LDISAGTYGNCAFDADQAIVVGLKDIGDFEEDRKISQSV